MSEASEEFRDLDGLEEMQIERKEEEVMPASSGEALVTPLKLSARLHDVNLRDEVAETQTFSILRNEKMASMENKGKSKASGKRYTVNTARKLDKGSQNKYFDLDVLYCSMYWTIWLSIAVTLLILKLNSSGTVDPS